MDSRSVSPDELNFSYPSPIESITASELTPSRKRKSSLKASGSQSDHSTKKRKAWGQPVPEIVPILPPRKRAKTAEEKEQRKNERILRNRRAADKSRQRQKAAVADMETRTAVIEMENANLKAMLEHYRSKFGELDGVGFDHTALSSSSSLVKVEPSFDTQTPIPLPSVSSPQSYVSTPAMAPNSPVLLPESNILPSLTNNLFPQNPTINVFETNTTLTDGFERLASGMTQYPAAMLCDLQCQPEASTPSTFNQFIKFLSSLNLWTLIFETSWILTLTPLYQVYQILVGTWPASSVDQTMSNIFTNHFPLILGLIFPPSPMETFNFNRVGTFRIKLLSRLLTCSPKMARLLLAATDREMRVTIEDECFIDETSDSIDLKSQWARLMTLKWMVVRLEVEHGRFRRLDENERRTFRCMAGIDHVGLERGLKRWKDHKAQRQPPSPRESEVYYGQSPECKVY